MTDLQGAAGFALLHGIVEDFANSGIEIGDSQRQADWMAGYAAGVERFAKMVEENESK